MKYLITGGCGFVGSNLSAEVLKRGEELVVFDNLSRVGSNENLNWLRRNGDFVFYPSDIRNNNDVETVIKEVMPDVIFHLAGQVAMTTSLRNPRLDFETNTVGTLNVLEAVRKYSPESIILYSSTNKVYGDLEYLKYRETESRYICDDYPDGFDETLPLSFQSPYGCSKGAADQYLLDYFRLFDIRTVVFRHSSMYGGHQHATYDQGWVGWFVQKAKEVKQGQLKDLFNVSGTGKQVRDLLHAEDVVRLYFDAVRNIDKVCGRAYNIGGGLENSLSLIELFDILENRMRIKLSYERIEFRKSDQKVFIANIGLISDKLDWSPSISKWEGLNSLL